MNLNTLVTSVWGYNESRNNHEPLPVNKTNVYNLLKSAKSGIVYLTPWGLLYLTYDLSGINSDQEIRIQELALFSNNIPF